MTKKVKILGLPKAVGGGTYGLQTPPGDDIAKPGNPRNTPEIKIRRTLGPTDKENATLEAEKGETVVTNLQGEGIPEFYIIGGKPHSRGGTPLNLPDNSFIFSQNLKTAIDDPNILKMFGKTKGKYTPADLSKTYNINKYREILANPFSDTLQRETAELMIQNYNLKLGAIALIQESGKGFDRGIPAISIPYLESTGIAPEEMIVGVPPTEEAIQQFRGGGQTSVRKNLTIESLPKMAGGGPVQGETHREYLTRTGETDPDAGYNTTWDDEQWVNTDVYNASDKPEETEPTTSKAPTAVQNIPKGSTKWDPNATGYDYNNVQPGDYVKQSNGRFHKVTGRKQKKYTGELYDDPNLGTFQEAYSRLVDKFSDQKLRDAFVTQYKKEIATVKATKHMTQADIDKASAMEPDEIIDNFLYNQKVNLAINVKHGDLSNLKDNKKWDTDSNLSNKVLTDLGYKPTSTAQNVAFETAYIGLDALIKDPQYKDVLSDVKLAQVGVSDDTGGNAKNKSISRPSGWAGNTLRGQAVMLRDSELVTEDVADLDPVTGALPLKPVKHLDEIKDNERGKYWTEDLVNLSGALGDRLNLKKYNPWDAEAQFVEADPQFVDFRGAAARMASGTNNLAEQSAMFGPQAAAAMNAKLQRGMVEGVTQLQEQENRTNVGTANEFEKFNTQARNQYNQQSARQDTALYDKQTIANQSFDNAKRALNSNVRQMFNNAWTNKGKTQSLNSLREEFKVDPTTGYTHHLPSSRKFVADDINNADYISEMRKLQEAFPGTKSETLTTMYKDMKGLPASDLPVGVNPAAYQGYGS